MEVHVVVGVFSGLFDEVHVYQSPENARKKYEELREEYGIKEGDEEHSEHEVMLVACEVK
jgi:hypothetical protein